MGTHWDGYWTQGGGGCLPEARGPLAQTLEAVWREFAGQLATGAKVLDLATGNGAVLRMIAGSGRRVDLLGVDSARVLPKSAPGITLKAGVAMEKLPFRDRQFDAVTSQFGIEYGDVAAIVGEVARVLKPGGAFRFVVHKTDGPIVVHNKARRAALAWAREESGIMARALQLARARQMAPLPTPPSFAQAVEEAKLRFPGQTAAAEFHAAILQTLEMGRTHPPGETLEVLAEIERRAGDEISRLDALAAAARDADGAAELTALLRVAGLDPRDPAPIPSPDGAFAWRFDGRA